LIHLPHDRAGGCALLILAALLYLRYHIARVYGVTRGWSDRAPAIYRRDEPRWFDLWEALYLCGALVLGALGAWIAFMP